MIFSVYDNEINLSGPDTQTNPAKTGRMATTNLMANPISSQTLTSRLRDYYTLTKPEVNLLILMTTSAGYYLASRGPFRIAGLVNTLAGTLLVASGNATLNQWMERVWDGQMRRTATRPLPSGRLSARDALLFGIVLSVAGGLYLAITVNLLSAFLAVSTLLSYLLVYTPLKRKTPLCTLLGAFPGAMPTLIGWAGASAGIDRHAWYLDLAQRELEAMEGKLNSIIVQRIGPERARHFIDNWRQLVVVLKRGELRPGHLKAVKTKVFAT